MNGYLLHRDQGELRASGKTATWFKATGDTTGGLFALVEEDAARGQGRRPTVTRPTSSRSMCSTAR